MSKFETAVVEAQIFFGEGDTGSALACLATAKRAIMDWNGFLRIGETPERLAWVQALAEVVNQSRIAKGYKTLRL